MVPNLRGRIDGWLDRLDDVLTHDIERGRAELRTIFSERIKLSPDESRKFLWADYSLGLVPLLPAGSNAEIMVAGACYGYRLPRTASALPLDISPFLVDM